MTARDIPSDIVIRGQRWRVLWRNPEDSTWRTEGLWGATFHDTQEIHLCTSLRYMPAKLQEIWVHELLHASLPHRVKHGRPRGVDNNIEEKLINTIAPALALALNQTGWRRYK